MGLISELGRKAWRKYALDGVSSSGFNMPDTIDIFPFVDAIDASMSSLVDGLVIGGAVVYSTRAALYADLAHAAGKLGVVYNDGTAAYNGVYVKSGSSGSGSWAITSLALPSTFAADLAAALTAIDGLEADIAGKLDGTLAALNTLIGTADHKTAPVDADVLVGRDSEEGGAPLKRFTIGGIKSAFKAYFDGFYPRAAATAKVTPVDADIVGYFDSENTNAPKRMTLANLKAFFKSYFDGLYPSKSLATDRLLGRDTAGTGDVEAIGLAGGLTFTGSSQISLADMPQATVKGRVAGAGTGTPTDVTMTQLKVAAALDNVDNTPDMGKPVSTAQAAAIAAGDDAIQAELDSRLPEVEYEDPTVPVIVAGDAVIMGLRPDGVDFPRLSEWTKKQATDRVISEMVEGEIVPLIRSNEQVALWLDENGINGPGLTRLHESIAQVGVQSAIPLVEAGGRIVMWLDETGISGPGLRPAAGPVPLATDGRSLHRMRAKQTLIRRDVAGTKLKIALTGDSWAELSIIPYLMRQMLETAYGLTGEGYQTVTKLQRPSPVTIDYSAEWTLTDGSETSNFPYGVGADGKTIWTASSAATLSIADMQCTSAKIFYRHHGGTFRWRIDGGAWTTVTCDSSGGFGVVDISGLADAMHLLEMDTAGNAGTVSITGFYSTGSALGAEMSRMGNSGLTGWRLKAFTQYIQDVATEIEPDIVVTILGTNDYRFYQSPPQTYIEALGQLAAAYRAAVPDVGLIFVLPPQSSTAALPQMQPLSQYRDALYTFCTENNCEFLNLFDQFGSYEQSNALGLWGDFSHLNGNGAALFCQTIDKTFLKI